MDRKRLFAQLVAFSLACAASPMVIDGAKAAPPKSTSLGADQSGQRIRASLVSEHDALVPGESTTIAVVMDIERGWYTYWQNPGDTGFELSVRFDAPEGLTIGKPIWPAPKRKVLPGDILDYVYTGRALVLFDVTVDPGLAPGQDVTIGADASWLVCKGSCIPEDAELALTLPVRSSRGDGAASAEIRRVRGGLPTPLTASDGISVELASDVLMIEARGASKLTFFPDYQEDVEAVDMIADGEAKGDSLTIRYESLGDAPALTGVLGVEREGTMTYHRVRATRAG